MTELIKELVKHEYLVIALLIIIIGFITFIFGAIGKIPKVFDGTQKIGNIWQIIVSVFGVLLVAVGIFFWTQRSKIDDNGDVLSCNKYGIQITSPKINSTVQRIITRISGTYREIPDGWTLWLFSINREAEYTNYRPKTPATHFDKLAKMWESDADVNFGNKRGEGELGVFLIGKNGEILVNYHIDVGRKTDNWIPITKLPSDIILCDSIKVTIQ